jgi:hypothetical protein
MSDEPENAQPPERAPNRLKELGYPLPAAKRMKPLVLKELSGPMHFMLGLMVEGTRNPDLLERLNPQIEEQRVDPDTGQTIKVTRRLELGEPFTLIQAADAARIKRRNARDLFTQQVFKRELDRRLQALREGAKPRALHRVIEILNDKSSNRAADKKVAMEAADRILEREGASKSGPAVNINIGPTISPGYVIRLPPKREPPTIEGEVVRKPADILELRQDSARGVAVAGVWPPSGDDAA